MRRLQAALGGAVLLGAVPAMAAEPAEKSIEQTVSMPGEAARLVPKLTVVSIEVLAPVGSNISKSLDTFPIRLVDPIVIDGKVLVPAGATGVGEVVHAKKAGGGGAPGELVLAARYLDVGGQRLLLRSLHLSPSGESKIRTANDMAVAATMVVPVAAVFSLMMKGGEITVAPGTHAEARTAQDFTVEGASAPLAVVAGNTSIGEAKQ